MIGDVEARQAGLAFNYTAPQWKRIHKHVPPRFDVLALLRVANHYLDHQDLDVPRATRLSRWREVGELAVKLQTAIERVCEMTPCNSNHDQYAAADYRKLEAAQAEL